MAEDNLTHPLLEQVRQHLEQTQTLTQLLERVMDAVMDETGAERGCLMLDQPQAGGVMIHRGGGREIGQFPFSRRVVDTVLDEGKPIVCFDAGADGRLGSSQSLQVHGTRSVLCVPVNPDNGSQGLLYLDSSITRGIFEERHANLVDQVFQLVLPALERFRSEKPHMPLK